MQKNTKKNFKMDGAVDEIPKNELFSSISHLFGIILSIIGTTILITVSSINKSDIHVFVFFIYGFSMILLYTMSSLYHIFPKKSKIKKLFRKFDHISIFLLISGTYTPACTILLPNALGVLILSVIWGLAIFGIIFKAIYVHSPGWFNGLIYALMGWVAIFAFKPIYDSVSINGFMLLLLGGIFYTVGAIIYAISKKFNPIVNMRMHDVFHIFILLGSIFHFWFMLKYIAPVSI